ncbi:zinc-dependent alcohol dehydrogenase [Roseisalinus antarcticus]|uniref:Putative zinc-type alcohol dehydrogenase-like protein YjmD n=1 Tax=Roseisalinus antarcticus TaxID=254357 RepID=A0A1Y5REZ8_9RHOB|nr:alcohol dehydrogenase catalytic domain-containing protein [Roseisalinus antarcticus]SLN15026.1 putative zinc-type alcohol dehydrogenase-like protein YjmD [Roseisalinus antarcticus]
MRAVRLHAAGDLRVERIAPPVRPSDHEVTLAVTMAGICGSDLHNYRTGAWISRAPSVAGHEFTGVVTAAGPGVEHVAIGQRVIVYSRHTCGICPACRDGVGQVCADLGFLGEVIDGGFAEAVTLPGRNVLPAPDVPDRHLAMAEPLAVALHALGLAAVPEGAGIVITGCGPIGALSALLARRMGHRVAVLDRNATRAAHVAAHTGAEVVDLDSLSGRRVRHAIETTGNPGVIRGLLGAIAGASRITLVGIGAPAAVIDPVHLVEREIALQGSRAFRTQELARIAGMLPALSAELDPFIAAEIALEDVPATFAEMTARGSDGIKTLIRCAPPGATTAG